MPWGDAQDGELLAFFRQLIAFRRRHPALSRGQVETLHVDDGQGVWLARRTWNDDQVIIAVNAGDTPAGIALPPGKYAAHDGEAVSGTLALAPVSGVLLEPAP
jgi:alpha-amylase